MGAQANLVQCVFGALLTTLTGDVALLLVMGSATSNCCCQNDSTRFDGPSHGMDAPMQAYENATAGGPADVQALAPINGRSDVEFTVVLDRSSGSRLGIDVDTENGTM